MSESKQQILAALGGIPEEVYDGIVISFKQEAKEKVAQSQQACANNDFDTIARCAHSIKGSSSNLHLIEVNTVAKALEFAAKNKDMANTTAFIQQLSCLL